MRSNNIFKTQETKLDKLQKYEVKNEAEVHSYFEKHLKNIIGADYIAKEYYIGKGRIDTLAIDEDNRPVIIEYKKSKVGSAVLQALFYKNWILKNRRQFTLEVKDRFGKERADNIQFKPRVIIVAQEFDEWTIASTSFLDDVELFSFSFYQNKEFLNLEYIKKQDDKNNLSINNENNENFIKDATTNNEVDYEKAINYKSKSGRIEKTNLGIYLSSQEIIKETYKSISDYVLGLDENINLYKSLLYWSFKKERKFLEIIFLKNAIKIQLFLKNRPKDIDFYEWKGNVGHWGTLNHQFLVKDKEDFDLMKKYINISFKNIQEI